MLTADAEFRAAANAAFAAWQNAPPYIAYRVDVNVNIKALNKTRTISRAIEARTRDDLAVLQDLPQGQNQLGHSFPVSPAFDAISYFRLDFRLTDPIRQHNPLTAITLLPPGPNLPPQPIRFADVAPSRPDIAVVSVSLRNYYAQYAPDSGERIAHIVMQPLTALTRGNDSTYYLKDVYVDLATDLPTRVVYSGSTTEFDLDYSVIDSHWVITHAYYQESIYAPFHIGQTTFTTDARYTEFAFPAEPRDERLRERPAR